MASSSNSSSPSSSSSSSYSQYYDSSGLLYSSNGSPTFDMLFSEHTRTPSNINLNQFNFPADGKLIFSASGLVLYRTLQPPMYHVCNPFSETHLSFPIQEQEPDQESRAIAMVVDHHDEDAVPDSYIIFIRYGPNGFSYSFDVFSSHTLEHDRASIRYAAGRIVERTGVSCTGKVYWLTVVNSIVSFDVAEKMVHSERLPNQQWDHAQQTRRQLGRAGNHLCFIFVTESKFELYVLDFNERWFLWKWRRRTRMKHGAEKSSQLCAVRSLSLSDSNPKRLKLFFVWMANSFCWEGSVSSGPPRDLMLEFTGVMECNGPLADDIADSLPYINTGLLPCQD